MYKKILFTLIAFILTINITYAEGEHFDISNINNGIVKVTYKNTQNKKIKVMIQKDDKKSFYNFFGSNEFPLTYGNGKYTIAILENTQGLKYKSITVKKIDVNIINSTRVYINKNQKINWNDNMAPIKKAKELTKSLTSDKEKAIAIYNYLITNFKYDYNKINTINNTYIPNIETVYNNKQGICSDFSTLYASMLRSINIPTKYVEGYKNDLNTFHAWNEVYIKDLNTWITVDITYDNTLFTNNMSYSFEKNSNEYKIKNIL